MAVDIESVGMFLAFWAGMYMLDIVLRTNPRSSSVYCRLVDGNGISIAPGQVRWYTQRFNSLFLRMGHWQPGIMQVWFTLGAIFGLAAMVVSVGLLCYTVLITIRPNHSTAAEEQVLTPVMPGVNLPANQLIYYLFTLLVCGILHELGHALAAVRERVHVNGFGVFFLALYPGAFVDLCTDQLYAISPVRQLRIFCAGVWHNFIIVLLAVCVLLTSPYVLAPFYHVGTSLVITHVVENSPVSGPRGLSVGDRLTWVDRCRVTSVETWMTCVEQTYTTQTGYCLSHDQIRQQDTSLFHHRLDAGGMECCANISNTHICFKYLLKEGAVTKYACLPARHVTESRHVCRLPSDCHTTHDDHTCAIPSRDNNTRLIRIVHGRQRPLLFLGHPMDLLYSVQVSSYVPRWSLIPLDLPYVLRTFCTYLISLSGALVVLNVVPCYALDGQWIMRAYLDLGLARVTSRKTKNSIFTFVLFMGTLLLAANILIALWTLFR